LGLADLALILIRLLENYWDNNMAIDINSLFADIIDTPEQRQQKLLQQGMVQGQLLSSGLRGRAAALAPLAQMAGQLGVQRNENLRRAVQPMLGIDPRTTGEKMAEQLKGLDPENPDSLLQAAQALQSIDPVRAAALRQAAAQKRDEQTKKQRESFAFSLDVAKATSDIESVATTRQETLDRRQANLDLIDSSESLSKAERDSLKKVVLSGGYDANQSQLLSIVDQKPMTFGNQAIIKKDGKWQTVTQSAADQTANGLLAAAKLRFKDDSAELAAATALINSGKLTKISELDDIAPEKEFGEIPSSVEKYNQESSDIANSALTANGRINSIVNKIESEGLLTKTTGGLVSRVRSATFKELGMRDEEEFLRTAYTRQKNTEIINSLPPGVASDTDIAIFSKGFPPEDATMQEIYSYMQSARNINYLTADRSRLLESHIQSQVDNGRTATTVGFTGAFQDYQNNKNLLDSEINKIKSSDLSPQEQEAQAGNIIRSVPRSLWICSIFIQF
jgi:hypothetical protein